MYNNDVSRCGVQIMMVKTKKQKLVKNEDIFQLIIIANCTETSSEVGIAFIVGKLIKAPAIDPSKPILLAY